MYAIREGEPPQQLAQTPPFGSIVDIPACDASGDHVAFSMSPLRIPLRPPCDVYLWSRDGVKQLTHGGENRYPAFARGGKMIVFSSAPTDGPLHVWEIPIAGGPAVRRTSGPGNDFAPGVTADDRTLTFNLDQTVQTVWAYGGTKHRDRVSPAQVDLTSLAVAPDGRLLSTRTTLAGDDMVEISPADGSMHAVASGREAVSTPRGDAIAFVELDRETSRISAMTGGATRQIAAIDGEANALYIDAQRIVHVEVARGPVRLAMQVPFDGSSPPRGEDPDDRLVLPAPSGWVLHLLRPPSTKMGRKTLSHMVVGAARLDPPPGTARSSVKLGDLVEYAAWNAGGTVVVYFERGTVHRFDVAAAR